MELPKMKEELATEKTKALAACAEEYVGLLRKFEELSKTCDYRDGGRCRRLRPESPIGCSILGCPYCAPVYALFLSTSKLNA